MCNLFHREAVCGKNEYLYTSALAYGTKTFCSCHDLVIVMGAGGGMLSVGTWIWYCLIRQDLILLNKWSWHNYNEGTVIYAYAIVCLIDLLTMWRGAILCEVDWRKIIDKCRSFNGIQPAPENAYVVGITFDKKSPSLYAGQNCDTYRGSLTHPTDCQWENCLLPSSISSHTKHVQMTMTMAILVHWT